MSTTTEQDRGEQNIREAIEAEMPNLPTVAELAGPILSTIYRLHDLQDLAWYISFLDTRALDAEAVVVGLIDDVAALVEAAVESCCVEHDDAVTLGAAARRIILTISQSADLRQQHHCRRAQDLLRGDHAAVTEPAAGES